MLLHSKAGTLRGGHSHDVYEMALVLAGQMLHLKPAQEGLSEVRRAMKPGDVSRNNPGEAHLGKFPEDTWLIDFKPGTPAHTAVDTDYEPYREKVKRFEKGIGQKVLVGSAAVGTLGLVVVCVLKIVSR